MQPHKDERTPAVSSSAVIFIWGSGRESYEERWESKKYNFQHFQSWALWRLIQDCRWDILFFSHYILLVPHFHPLAPWGHSWGSVHVHSEKVEKTCLPASIPFTQQEWGLQRCLGHSTLQLSSLGHLTFLLVKKGLASLYSFYFPL